VSRYFKIKVSIFIEIRYLFLDFQAGFLLVPTWVATKFCVTFEKNLVMMDHQGKIESKRQENDP